MTTQQSDLIPPELNTLAWDDASRVTSLDALYTYAVTRAEAAIKWYLLARRPKKRWAVLLRTAAIISTSLAALVPILQSIAATAPPPSDLPWPTTLMAIFRAPAWASVFLGCAAALVLIDRFFGFSTAWMRYMDTQLRINRILDDFRADWAIQKLSWAAQTPSTEEAGRMVLRVKVCLGEINAILQAETGGWIDEFRDAIKQIDTAATKPVVSQPIVTLSVTNGDKSPEGWNLKVDGHAPSHHTGTSLVINDLPAGPHTLTVQGTIENKVVHATTKVVATPGTPVNAQVTLS